MIFFSIGLPSRFAEWCDLLASRLAKEALGASDLVSANNLEEIGLAAVKSQSEHLVISARQLTADLQGALAAAACGFIIALDDPRAALQNLVVGNGIEWMAATRATATSCASMLAYALMPRALVLRANQDGRDPVATAGAIARCFGFELDAAQIASCAASLPQFDADGPGTGADPWWDDADPAHREIASGALNGYADYFSGHGLSEIIWSRELFFVSDDPPQPANRVVDLAGEIRNLLFGPYIALPPGGWNGAVNFAVSKEAAGMNFRIEVLAGPRCVILAQTNITPDKRGLCLASLAFTVDASTDQPIQLRVANLLPASSGRLAFGQVVLTTQTSAHVEIPAELSTALGL
jgi:hypothetical protein